MSRRGLGLSLLACLAGSALALYAVTRRWSVEVTPRIGMSALRTVRTGADAQPWVLGLALVALAGAGAMLATGGRVRRLVGVLLALAGTGVTVGAILGRLGLAPGAAGPGGTVWPVACAFGGALIVGGGLAAARHGHRWPGISARYERRPWRPDGVSPAPRDPGGDTHTGDLGGGASVADGVAAPVATLDHRATWDALDRGEDPTE